MLGFKAFALFALAAFSANAIPIGGADTSALNGPLEAAGARVSGLTGNVPVPRDLPLGGAPVPGVDVLLGTLTGAVGSSAVGGGAVPGLRRQEIPPAVIGGILGSVEGAKAGLKGRDLAAAGGVSSLPVILRNAIFRLNLIIADIRAAVAVVVGVKVDIQVVLHLLAQVVAVLEETVAEIKVLLTNPVGNVLQLGAVILGLPEVAFLLASLLFLVLSTLALVVVAIASLEIAIKGQVYVVIQTIVTLLSVVLSLSFELVPGLLVVAVGVIQPVLALVAGVEIQQIIVVLGIAIQ